MKKWRGSSPDLTEPTVLSVRVLYNIYFRYCIFYIFLDGVLVAPVVPSTRESYSSVIIVFMAVLIVLLCSLLKYAHIGEGWKEFILFQQEGQFTWK